MTQLEDILHDIITNRGPISLAAYMELALQHPEHGYYRKRFPFGRAGDFVTAPDISQMFGEMIAVWCVEKWKALGTPSEFALIEFGPGRGTMMSDLLRATSHVHGFQDAMRLFLIESNEVLRAKQRELLASYTPVYINSVADTPSLPIIAVANEFFDAMPVRQFEMTFRGWAERMVSLEKGQFVFTQRMLSPAEILYVPSSLRDALPGTVFEFSPQGLATMRDIARAISSRTGVFLTIDYGYTALSGTPSVQAVAGHAHADILDRPGEVDLTAHVNFTALADAARAGGAEVSAVMPQGEFLKNCGIEIRASALRQHADTDQAAAIDGDLERLCGSDQMGTLFKVMEIRC